MHLRDLKPSLSLHSVRLLSRRGRSLTAKWRFPNALSLDSFEPTAPAYSLDQWLVVVLQMGTQAVPTDLVQLHHF